MDPDGNGGSLKRRQANENNLNSYDYIAVQTDDSNVESHLAGAGGEHYAVFNEKGAQLDNEINNLLVNGSEIPSRKLSVNQGQCCVPKYCQFVCKCISLH